MEDEPSPPPQETSSSSSSSPLLHTLLYSVFSWLGVYLLGYFNLSVAWLVTPFLLGLLHDRWKKEEKQRLSSAAEAALTDEQTAVESRMQSVEDLPSWVFFPDRDRAEWFNRILQQLWPSLNIFVRNTLFDSVEPAVKEALEGYKMKGFKFERDRVYLGQIPPRITGIKVYESKLISRSEIIMDVDIAYAGDMEIVFSLRPITGKMSDLSLRGMMRVVLKPLITEMPLIGGVQVYFLTKPTIHFELGGVGSVPGLSGYINKTVSDMVADMLVLPNKMTVPLAASLPTKVLKCPDTAGVLRVKLHGAKDLMAKDFSFKGKGTSDPYGLLTVGATLHNVPVRKSTLTPSWEIEYDFPIEVVHGQQLILELFDDDKGSDDEFLGRAIVQTSVVAERGTIEKSWIDLESCKSGKVELSLSWLPITRDANLVKDSANKAKPEDENHESAKCLVHVYIDSVANLVCGKGSYKPAPVVQLLNSQNQGRKTWPQYKTNDPIIEQGFVLLVTNPQLDSIRVRVLDSSKGDEEIAHTQIDIWPLIHEPNMEYSSQPWILQGNNPDATIVMSVELCGLIAAGDEGIKEVEDKEEDVSKQLTVIKHHEYDEEVKKGKIKVVVHKAVDLEAKDVGGTSDPYVKIKYENQKFKTDTVKKTVNPNWEYEVSISTVPDGDKQILFEVFDKDKIGKDETLGFTTVDVRIVSKQGKMNNIWEPLQGCQTGRILLSLEFYPEDEILDDEEEGKSGDSVKEESKMEVGMEEALGNKDDEVGISAGKKGIDVEKDKQDISKSGKENTNDKESDENIPTTFEAVSEAVSDTLEVTSEVLEVNETVTKTKENKGTKVKDPGIENIRKITPGILTILVVKAEDLESKDFNGKSDPYVKIVYNGKAEKSQVHKKTLNPSLNYGTKWTISQDSPSEIFIELFDHDGIGKDESLGTITLDVRDVVNTIHEVWFNLEDAKSGKVLIKFTFEKRESENRLEKKSKAPLTPYGKIRMTMRYDEHKSELKVFVHSAVDLPGSDLPDPPDPYVSLCLVPDTGKTKKTKVVVDSCSPNFDQEFDFNIKLAKLLGQKLQVSVMDKKGVFAKSSILGRKEIILDNPCLCQGITDWFPLEKVLEDSK